jgi:broad specificity phosphatase PhoE
MTTLHLVRHAEAAAGWGDDLDPGLSARGLEQASAMAARFPDEALPIISSPLRRARETAHALEQRWSTAAIIEPGVGEIPGPSDDLAERQTWLRSALRSTWPELGARYTSWRTMVLELLLGVRDESVVITHFVLINAVIGAATGSDAVTCRMITNASVVRVEHDDHRFIDLELPAEPSTDAGPIL